MSYLLVIIYLIAVIGANLIVAHVGPNALFFTAFFFVSFDFMARSILHERWQGNRLFIRMFCLILIGSGLSYLVNRNTQQIAIANCVSFFISENINYLIYILSQKYKTVFKMNLANIGSSLIDSFIFPYIAFSLLDPIFSLGQAATKIIGGLFWSFVFLRCFRFF